tara:strand:+ start:59961 stop:60464 length:504 start_codon:yes stop_codon:yes gene_type:complete
MLPALLADLGDYWVIIAMIFIAFFRWFFTERGRTQEEEEFEYEPDQMEDSGPPPIPGEARSKEPEGAEDLRRFLEQLAGKPAEPPPPPVQAVRAIPVEKPVEAPALSKEEIEALERIKTQVDHYAPEAPKQRSHRSLRLLLSDSASLRNAILLKEILDKPVALKDSR